MEQLQSALLASASVEAGPRKAAEAYLEQAKSAPGFALAALQLAAAPGVDEAVRVAAAVAFKNAVKFHWSPALPPADGAAAREPLAIGAAEKEQVKARLVGVMLGTPGRVQAQLSEALALVAAADFPDRWPTLLPELLAQVGGGELGACNGALGAAHAVFLRFRDQYKTVELVKDLKYVLGLFVAPMLQLLQATGARLAGPEGAQPEAARALLTTVLHICRIFFSLNYQDLPEVFEDSMAAWMAEFMKYLPYSNAALAGDGAGVVDALKAAICEDVNLLLEKSEDEFAPYLRDFATAVWQQLVAVGTEPGQDALATEALRFLTTIASGVHHALFAEPATLRLLCENIIIPNLQFRAADEELFEDNSLEYIRRDMEGSDADTRRRGACELLRALTSKFQDTLTAAVSTYVGNLLAEYAAAPGAAWKQKDCAIYLVIALTVRGKTEARGATVTNELVNVADFFASHLLPELLAPVAGGSAVLKADALKFVTTFRSQLPKPVCAALLPAVGALLGHPAGVVHSYAALALERLLTVRDGPHLRFGPDDLLPLREQLLTGLFGALQHPDGDTNEYVMKAAMRLLSSLGAHSQAVAPVCAERLGAILLDLGRNPRAPTFSHYTFEAVAVVVRGAVADPASAPLLEQRLFPPFTSILQADCTELAPYVFQVLSQLVEGRPAPLPPTYLALFPPLLAPLLWERPGNVPALVRLLQAYLGRALGDVLAGGHLAGVLGVFQRLNASRAHDHEGFYVLNSLVEALPADRWGPHLTTVWGLLLQRLQHSSTPKYARSFAVFFALLVARHGPAQAQAGLDAVQPGLFCMLIEHVWLKALPGIPGDTERRLAAVAGTRLLCDCAPLQGDAAAPLWGRLLEAVVGLLTEEAEEGPGGPPPDDDEPPESVGTGGAVYARLMGAARPETEPVAEARTAPAFLATSLAQLAAKLGPGRLQPRIAQALAPSSLAALAKLFVDAGVALV